MAKRNLDKMIQDGRKHGCVLYADEMHHLRELAAGSDFHLIEAAYLAGVTAGYNARKKEDAAKRKRAAANAHRKEQATLRAHLADLGFTPYEVGVVMERVQRKAGKA